MEGAVFSVMFGAIIGMFKLYFKFLLWLLKNVWLFDAGIMVICIQAYLQGFISEHLPAVCSTIPAKIFLFVILAAIFGLLFRSIQGAIAVTITSLILFGHELFVDYGLSSSFWIGMIIFAGVHVYTFASMNRASSTPNNN